MLKACMVRIENPAVKRLGGCVFDKLAELKTTIGAQKDIIYIENLKAKFRVDFADVEHFIEKLDAGDRFDFYTPLKRREPALPEGIPWSEKSQSPFVTMVKTEDEVLEIPNVEVDFPAEVVDMDIGKTSPSPKVGPDLAAVEELVDRKLKRE